MWQDGFRGGRGVVWLLGRASLRVRLLAAALCLLAAGAAIITGAGGLVARGYLMRQADQQLRAYAGRLVSRPIVASPIYGLAPGAPSAAGPGGTALRVEVRGSAGQLVMGTGPRARPGPAIPAVRARPGQPVTVAAGSGGGSWRVIAEPIHYRVRRIPFSYNAEGISVSITSQARPGLAGTLVVGLDLAGIGHATGRLAVTGLAVSGVVVLIITCSGMAVIRAILRPVTQAQQALAAAAAGELSARVPDRHGGSDAGHLASSLNKMLSQTERALSTLAESEAAARRSGERMCRAIADTGCELRRPLSVIHGFADAYRQGSRPRAGEPDRMMRRVTDEAARMDALIDDLLPARNNQPPPQR